MQQGYQELFSRLGGVGSGQVSDALEALGLPQRIIIGLHRFDRGEQPLVGSAWTIQQACKDTGDAREQPMVRHGEATRGAAPPGSVIVIDVGGNNEIASWGDNHTQRCAINNIAGAIIYGATRDPEAIAKQSVPVFACGTSPVKSRWSLKTVAMGEKITIQSVEIVSGDIIFADAGGCIVFPEDRLVEVVEQAERIADLEKQ